MDQPHSHSCYFNFTFHFINSSTNHFCFLKLLDVKRKHTGLTYSSSISLWFPNFFYVIQTTNYVKECCGSTALPLMVFLLYFSLYKQRYQPFLLFKAVRRKKKTENTLDWHIWVVLVLYCSWKNKKDLSFGGEFVQNLI